MAWQYTPHALGLFFTSALSGAILSYIWLHRRGAGARALGVTMLAVVLWCVAYALELGSTDYDSAIFWAKAQYPSIVTIPTAVLVFALQHTGRVPRLEAWHLIALCVLPLLTLALALTNEAHGMIWSEMGLDVTGAFPTLHYEHGTFFYVYWVYSYLLLIAGSALIFSLLLRPGRLYNWQGAVVLLGLAAPWLANGAYVLELGPVQGLDLTPIAFSVTGLAFTVGLLRFRFLDVFPVARDAVIENLSEGVIVLDQQDRVVDLNPATRPVLNRPVSGSIGLPAREAIAVWSSLLGDLEETGAARREVELRAHGEDRCYEVTLSPLRDRRSRVLGRLLSLHDVTDRKEAEKELRESEERYRRLVELSPNAIVVHARGRVAYINAAGVRMMGAQYKKDLLGEPVLGFVHPDYRKLVADRMSRTEELQEEDPVEEKFVRFDGEVIDVEVSAMSVPYAGEHATQLVIRDITRHKALETQLAHRASHDPLTGLPNRQLLRDRLEHTLSQEERRSGSLGIIYLDLDGFKQVNDTLGHDYGDQLLVALADRLRHCVRPGDTMARLGGDEFTVLLKDLREIADATQVADRILEALREPFVLGHQERFVTASIGIALNGRNNSTPEGLLRDADTAMYRAKTGGDIGYEVFPSPA
ncbi:MAG: diguanylate cyclase [Rubrobacter sp.]|nr:diguanylate cyclase [Rubrobacter sp.]